MRIILRNVHIAAGIHLHRLAGDLDLVAVERDIPGELDLAVRTLGVKADQVTRTGCLAGLERAAADKPADEQRSIRAQRAGFERVITI